MSWHCGFCGETDCTGLIYIMDIRGGIPLKYCVHLKCLAGRFSDEEISQEILELYTDAEEQPDKQKVKEAFEEFIEFNCRCEKEATRIRIREYGNKLLKGLKL